MDVGLPEATHENRAESPLYGELYPDTNLSQYQSPDTNMDKNGLLGPYTNAHQNIPNYIPIVQELLKFLLIEHILKY